MHRSACAGRGPGCGWSSVGRPLLPKRARLKPRAAFEPVFEPCTRPRYKRGPASHRASWSGFKHTQKTRLPHLCRSGPGKRSRLLSSSIDVAPTDAAKALQFTAIPLCWESIDLQVPCLPLIKGAGNSDLPHAQ